MMNTLKLTATSFILLLGSLGALAENSKEIPALYGATKIYDQDTDALVISLLNAYLLLREGVVTDRAINSGVAKINFYYASGPNFIVDQKLSRHALAAFDNDAVTELTDLPTNSDTCYVQAIVLAPSSQWLVLTVHNEDHGDSEDVFRCLIAGLWKFQERDLKQLDILDWRTSFYKLTSIGLD